MKIYKTVSKRKILLMWLITGISLAILLIFPTQCRAGAANGVFLCIQVLIPSLFPFMVLSSFIVHSGIASKLPNVVEKFTKCIFGLPKESFAVILLSMTGGYPVGAKGINSLYKENKITMAEAEQMSMFCVAAGPGFLVTYLGCSMLRSPQTGYILLISQTLSFLLLGIISKYTVKDKHRKTLNTAVKTELYEESSIVTSVNEAIRSCGYMCALVVLFGAICEIFLCMTEGTPQLKWITAVIEITNGIKILSAEYSVLLMSAMCGFGGLCVHFQVFALLGNIKISKAKFFIFRIFQTLLNTLFTYLLLKVFPNTAEVFSTVEKSTPKFNSSITGCIFLIICCVAFLLSLKEISRTHIKKR